MKRAIKLLDLWERDLGWKYTFLGCVVGTVVWFCAVDSGRPTQGVMRRPVNPIVPPSLGNSFGGGGMGGMKGFTHSLPPVVVSQPQAIEPGVKGGEVKLPEEKKREFGVIGKRKDRRIREYVIVGEEE